MLITSSNGGVMTRVYREIHGSRLHAVPDDEVVTTTTGRNLPARIVYVIGGFIVGILILRFILALLGANPANAFAHFIYAVSGVFAAPFFGLFNYHTSSGIARFEFETLIAIAVYGLLTWFIVSLLSMGDSYD